jgi:hypothetical protein
MDCQVDVKPYKRKKFRAKLLELSLEGCRFESKAALANGTRLSVAIPESLGGRALEISGNVIRSESQRGGSDVIVVQIEDLDSAVREQLGAIIRGDRIGTRVTPLAAMPEREPDAYIDGTGIPDWEDLARSVERRRHPRRPYPHLVETAPVRGAAESYSAMGVELSVEGMRIVGLPKIAVGSEVRVALHSNVGAMPIALEAKVLRNDGTAVALGFRSVTPELRAQIEALMNEKPCVEDLRADQRDRIVMSEVISIDCALGAR